MNKVYIILVNYNNYNDTIECLESVLKSSYANYQVFVVDNSPDNDSITQLLAWAGNKNYQVNINMFKDLVFPLSTKPLNFVFIDEHTFTQNKQLIEYKITFIRSKNRGFAAANNIALNYILTYGQEPSSVWILNNDTVIERDTLLNLATFSGDKANNKLILGAKLRYYDQPDVLQAVAGKYNRFLGMHKHIGDGEKDYGQYDNYLPGKMNYIVGASIFLPFLFLKETGLMCEDYFLYFEELDWLNMGRTFGYSMGIVPNAIVYHKEGSSIIGSRTEKKDTSTAEYYSITNRVRFIKKWYPWCLITVMPGTIWALTKRIMQGKLRLVKKSSITIFKILTTKNFPYFVNNG